MKLSEVQPQLSPDDEHCNLCMNEEHARVAGGAPTYIEANTVIRAFTPYHMIMTTEGQQMDLCDTHFYTIATLQ